MTPIHMLHFADIHIGTENYGHIDPETGVNGRVLDFLRRFNEVVDYAIEHEADLVLFAGDAFKTRDPNPTLQREFARRIRRLSEAGIPTILLVGNHDLPAMEKRASSVDIFRTLAVPNVVVAYEEAVHTVKTRNGPLQVATVPYPMRHRLLAREEFKGMSIEQLDRSLSDLVAENIEALAKDLDPDVPAVLAGHFSVSGAVWGSERQVMLGNDVIVAKTVLVNGPWDYVAMGHIHKHQDLNPGGYPPVVYAGSLERIDFGEERESKGFCWVEVAKGATTYEFIPIQARPMRTIEVDVTYEPNPTQAVIAAIQDADIADAIVRVLVRTTPEKESALNQREIESALEGAYYARINKEVERTMRARLGPEPPEGLTPQQLLERYLQAKGADPERIRTLLDYAKGIFDSE
jgi:exonuclease SbcD